MQESKTKVYPDNYHEVIDKKILENPQTPDDYEKIAYAAKDYARSIIKMGWSELAWNTKSLEQKESLIEAVTRVQYPHKIANCEEKISLITDSFLANYERSIAATKKFSIGNCQELAYQALDYCLNNVDLPNFSAMVYFIQNGNHVFLVIGRKENSDESDPFSWGKNAYICDPWANKVYPADKYLENLKAFVVEGTNLENQKNSVINFNPDDHQLKVRKNNDKPVSFEEIKKAYESNDSKNLLLEKFRGQLMPLRDFFDKLLNDFQNMNDDYLDGKAVSTFGKCVNEKHKALIDKKRSAMDELIKNMEEEAKMLTLQNKNYREIYQTLTKLLDDAPKRFAEVTRCSPQEIQALFAQDFSFKDKIYTFFKPVTTAEVESVRDSYAGKFNAAVENSNAQLESLRKGFYF